MILLYKLLHFLSLGLIQWDQPRIQFIEDVVFIDYTRMLLNVCYTLDMNQKDIIAYLYSENLISYNRMNHMYHGKEKLDEEWIFLVVMEHRDKWKLIDFNN